MECVVEAALKSSLRKDTTITMKLSPQLFLEELSALNVQNVATCDDFFVDDLLDFSHQQVEQDTEEEQQLLPKEEPQQQQKHVSVSVPQQQQSLQICNPSFGELAVPDDEAANLEWLSQFVEDSFTEYSVSFPTVTPKAEYPLAEKAPELVEPLFKTPVPARARSKRTRTGVRVWPLGFGSPSFTDSSSSSNSSSTTTATSSASSSSPTSPLLFCAAVTQNLETPPEKKPKRRAKQDGEGCGGTAAAPRRCSHCGVQKTPQWRTGPLGAKTLCNACGVRYKSGRLLPEYRPACSPTFSSELHSNHHRKVLEMRRKKEVTGGPETGSVDPPPVPGF